MSRGVALDAAGRAVGVVVASSTTALAVIGPRLVAAFGDRAQARLDRLVEAAYGVDLLSAGGGADEEPVAALRRAAGELDAALDTVRELVERLAGPSRGGCSRSSARIPPPRCRTSGCG
jgi:hypothetical protein